MTIIRHVRVLSCGFLLALCLGLGASLSWAADADDFSQAELDQLLAPVALYPDSVLSHVLIASSYPLEVVLAARWTEEHPKLSGAEALKAVEDRDWDPSVKALVAFPDLLQRMSQDLDWTERFGEAFLADEEWVLDSVQDLRQQAYDSGKLKDLEHLSVSREDRHIIIEPVVREVVYVPWYDTRVVYGRWRWVDYPPVYWHHHHHHHYHDQWVHWGPRIHLSWHFYFSAFRWDHRHVVVIHDHHYRRDWRSHQWRARHIAHHRDARRWHYDDYHRRGVHIRSARTRTALINRAPERSVSRASQDSVNRAPQRSVSRELRDRSDLQRRTIQRADIERRLEQPRPAREREVRRDLRDSNRAALIRNNEVIRNNEPRLEQRVEKRQERKTELRPNPVQRERAVNPERRQERRTVDAAPQRESRAVDRAAIEKRTEPNRVQGVRDRSTVSGRSSSRSQTSRSSGHIRVR